MQLARVEGQTDVPHAGEGGRDGKNLLVLIYMYVSLRPRLGQWQWCYGSLLSINRNNNHHPVHAFQTNYTTGRFFI